MSSLYNLEPPPTAKVLLNTTSGDLVFELFAKQAPLASRNFLQHCLDGYYDGTIFHRLVPGFIIQGGDPSGLGTGGISAVNHGAPFQDEFHSRLKFNRRGLLGMANSGEPNDNTSQFFVTLDQTPELQGKNTMFGRIEGDTIYNLMKMAEADLSEDGRDRPLYPTRILSTDVLLNPFDDMVKRVHVAERTKPDAPQPAKKKRKAGKNLLSFGADEGEEDAVAPISKKKAKVNPTFVAPAPPPAPALENDYSEDAPTPEPVQVKPKSRQSAKERQPSPIPVPETSTAHPDPDPESKPKSQPKIQPPQEEKKEMSRLDKVNQQIAELKASMKRTNGPAPTQKEEKKSVLETMIPATSTRGRKRGKVTDEEGAMNLFKSFKERLAHIPPPPKSDQADPSTSANHTEEEEAAKAEAATSSTNALDTEEKLCDLHFIANCQSCTAWDKDGNAIDDMDDDINDTEWMAHSLSFAKDTLGKDLEWRRKMDEFEVIDPREKAKEIHKDRKRDRRENKSDASGSGGGGRDWDRQRDKDRPKSKPKS